jgi:hypothetical protein
MNSDDKNRPEDSAPQDEQAAKLGNDDANKIGKFAQYTAPAMLTMLASTRPTTAVTSF